jgi:hypothetical protein
MHGTPLHRNLTKRYRALYRSIVHYSALYTFDFEDGVEDGYRKSIIMSQSLVKVLVGRSIKAKFFDYADGLEIRPLSIRE